MAPNAFVFNRQPVDLSRFEHVFKCQNAPRNYITLAGGPEVLEAVRAGKHMYEVIRADRPCREFYDIDLRRTADYPIHQDDDTTREIVRRLVDARNQVAEHTLSIRDAVVLTAHRTDKISVHVIFPDSIAPSITPALREVARVVDSLLVDDFFSLDTSVYTRNRLFRCAGHSKFGSDAVLVHAPGYKVASFNETLVGHYLPENGVPLETEHFDINEAARQAASPVYTGGAPGSLEEWVAQYPYLRLGTGRRIERIDSVSRPCLCFPGDTHSKENMFWYVTAAGELRVQCFCKQGKPIRLGKLTEVPMRDPVVLRPEKLANQSVIVGDRFLTQAEYEKLTSGYDIVFDKRQTGRGKTHNAIAAARDRGGDLLLLHHRQSLDTDYIKQYDDIKSYRQSKTRVGGSVSCVINSLGKKAARDVLGYSSIIIDEVRSVLRQADMPQIEDSVNALFNIFQFYTGSLVAMDANMRDSDIDFIVNMRRAATGGRVPSYVILETGPVAPSYECTMFTGGRVDAIDRLLKHDFKATPAVIAHNISLDVIDGVIGMLEEEKVRCYHINKHTKDQLVNLDYAALREDYDAIFYSPTIAEGVSISDPGYASWHGFGIFCDTSSGPESCSQQIRRFRAVSKWDVYLEVNPHTGPRFKTVDECHKFYQRGVAQLCTNVNRARRFDERAGVCVLEIVKDDFWNLFAKNAVEHELDITDFASRFAQLCVNNCFSVQRGVAAEMMSVEEYDQVRDEMNAARDAIRAQQYEAIATAPTITPEEFERLRDHSDRESDILKRRYQIMKQAPRDRRDEEYSTEFIEHFDNPKNRQRLANLRMFLQLDGDELAGTDAALHRLLDRDYERVASVFAGFEHTPGVCTRIYANKAQAAVKLSRDLGFQQLPALEPVGQADFNARVDARHKWFTFARYRELRQAVNQQASAEQHREFLGDRKKFIQFVNRVLKEYGIKIKADGRHARHEIAIPHVSLDRDKPNTLPLSLDRELPEPVKDQLQEFVTGSTGWWCSVCNLKLSKRGNHERTNKHRAKLGLPSLAPLQKKSTTCSVCNLTCSSRSNLIRHVRRRHKDIDALSMD